MARSNRQRVDETLILVAEGFGGFAEDQLRQHWGDRWQDEVRAGARGAKFDQHEGDLADPDYVLWLGTNQWRPVFYKQLSESDRAALGFLRQVRRDWAHNKTSFTVDETHRVVDMAHLLLSDCGAVEQAARLDELRQEVLRLKFEEQTKRAAAQAAEGLAVQGDVGGLRSWRDVVAPHQDVAENTFQLASFAADFREVHAGTAQPEYGDPVQFFRRTYLTRGLRKLLTQTLRRMNGVGGDPVIDLMTTFGGGKTHSLLAVYHLCGHGRVDDLAGVPEIVVELDGVDGMPGPVRRAVVIGNDFSPRGAEKPDGTRVNTLWGELAWQLGGRDAFELVRGDDEDRTSPGTTKLRELLATHAPCALLIDEWIAYARQLWNRDDLPGGTLDTHMTFAQSLTEAAKSVPNAMLVVSIPASDVVRDTGDEHSHEIGGVGGVEALRRLRSVVHRADTPWQPADSNEGFEIVRRRLFSEIDPDDLTHRDVTCRRFAELYARHPDQFPTDARRTEYEQRLKRAYPIHPELFDRLYEDWSALERFQRTRGVLRLMATVVHALWRAGDRSPLIMPSSVPLEDVNVLEEITNHLDDNWRPVVDRDVAGPSSTPAAIDREVRTLGRVQAAQRVARVIFLGSAPKANRRADGGAAVPNRGVETQRINLGCAFPGDTPALFAGDALRRLSERAAFLSSEGNRFWLSTQQTVAELARSKAQSYDDAEITDELADWIRRETDRGEFARVHRLPAGSADVDDEASAALVILGPERTHARNAQSAGLETGLEFTRHRGTRARQHQNMLLFLAPDANRLGDLLAAVRRHRAWRDVSDNRESYNLDQHNIRQAEDNLRKLADTIAAQINETYVWLLMPRQDVRGSLEIEALKVDGRGSLAERATRKAGENDLLICRFAPSNLRMELDGVPLWRDGDHVSVGQVWEDFARYPYLPRLRDEKVLLNAVVDGPQELNADQDGFGYAESFDEQQGRYRGLVLRRSADHANLNGLIVKFDAAQRQWETQRAAERAATDRGSETDQGTEDDARQSTHGGTGGNGDLAARARPKYFSAWKELDPVRAGRDARDIADEVLAHFADRGVNVKVTLEIEAVSADGFEDEVRRTVTENARTLGFGHYEFE
jgi:predicted AAA+ superfamily ATPase/uncharacterized small protein (DUF1192 family)